MTCSVTNSAPSGIWPHCCHLLMKCCMSLTYDLVLGTYFLCSSTNLLMWEVWWFIELQIGLPGMSV